MSELSNDFNYAHPTGDQSGYTAQGGLTKREWFAGVALQGLLAGRLSSLEPQFMAEHAIKSADALLKELERATV